MARQPIFDGDGTLAAYELLYRRNARDNFADAASPNSMASDVIVQAFLTIGMESMTDGRRAFLNFTREMLLDGVHLLFPPSAVVIELLETVEPDEAVVAACQALVAAGYTLALDDFEFHPRFDALLRIAHIVKLDVLGKDDATLVSALEHLRPYPVQLLAERVETREVQTRCAAMGFQLFQGYYFSRPEILTRRDLSTDELAVVQLMNLLRDANATDQQIEEAFRRDPGLTYKLLRAVNSGGSGGRGIESIGHAIRLTGRRELHKWLALLLLSSMTAKGGTDRELARMAVLRARFCELLGGAPGQSASGGGAHFIVGLFSLLDAVLRIPMEEMLTRIDLADEVRVALLKRAGPLGPPLSLAEAYERAEWSTVESLAQQLGLRAGQVPERYVEAVSWARAVIG